jgi:hypothetical protein
MKLLLNPKVLTFTFEIPAMESTEGVQKILGMAIGLKHHRVDYFPYWHRSNSILLGASAAVDNGAVKLWNYSYVDGKKVQRGMDVYKPGTKLKAVLCWKNLADISIYKNDKPTEYSIVSAHPPQPLIPVGYLLFPYREQDGKENKRKPFDVRVWDIKCNGKEIKL